MMLFFWTLFLHFPRAFSALGVGPASLACGILHAHPFRLLVSFPGEPQYAEDISHASAFTSEDSTCSVEPKTPEELSAVFQVIGQARSPFAIKSQGHANNPSHSSTPGVQISLSQFRHLIVSPESSQVELGTGLAWDEVYEQLESQGVMVVGGRIPGVGVGGFVLGGGYSYKSNQYGLASDTVVSYGLVTPAGRILNVTSESHPDLFFGLQGGLNNFGAVTSITMKSHTQTLVYAGTIKIPGASGQALEAFRAAVARFDAQVNDPKASMMGIHMFSQGEVMGIATLFYDAPAAPPGLFDDFLALKNASGGMKTTSYVDFIKSSPSLPRDVRVLAHSVPMTHYPLALIEEVALQTHLFGTRAQHNSSVIILATSIEPFQPSAFTKTIPEGSAYPHTPSYAFSPFNLVIAWTDPDDDSSSKRLLQDLASAIQRKAINTGAYREGATVYPNYAMEGTKLEMMYGGEEGVRRLGKIRQKWDPNDVLGLTGGFIFPWAQDGRLGDEL